MGDPSNPAPRSSEAPDLRERVRADSDYRDGSGRRLEDYPRPSVAVDTAVLTIPSGSDAPLSVLVVRRDGHHRRGAWQLPGTFVHPGETLAKAALRALQTKVQVEGLKPEQLHAFDDPRRDDRGWVLSAAHVDVVPADRLEPALQAGARLTPVDGLRGLAFDHDRIVALAVATVRRRYGELPDPARLLAQPFTLRELQRLHEAILGEPLRKDTFRRRMQEHLVETGDYREGTVGKPAREWKHPA